MKYLIWTLVGVTGTVVMTILTYTLLCSITSVNEDFQASTDYDYPISAPPKVELSNCWWRETRYGNIEIKGELKNVANHELDDLEITITEIIGDVGDDFEGEHALVYVIIGYIVRYRFEETISPEETKGFVFVVKREDVFEHFGIHIQQRKDWWFCIVPEHLESEGPLKRALD